MSSQGFAVVETTDAKVLYAWVAEWSEFLPLTTTPCLEEADAGAVSKSLKRWQVAKKMRSVSGGI
jgi:hypothetical protein